MSRATKIGKKKIGRVKTSADVYIFTVLQVNQLAL